MLNMSKKSIIKLIVIFIVLAIGASACFIKYEIQQQQKIDAEYSIYYNKGLNYLNNKDFANAMQEFNNAYNVKKDVNAKNMFIKASNGQVEQEQLDLAKMEIQDNQSQQALQLLDGLKSTIPELSSDLTSLKSTAENNLLNTYMQSLRNFIAQNNLPSALNVLKAMYNVNPNSKQYQEAHAVCNATQENNNATTSLNLVRSIINKL